MNEIEEMLQKMKELRDKARSNPVKEPEYECPDCKDSGIYSYIGEDGHEYARMCKCREMKMAKQIMERSGIAPEMREIGFKQYITGSNGYLINGKTRAFNYFKDFQKIEKSRNNSILLCGQVGAGKTHLGIAISNNLMELRIPVVYMPYRNVVTQLKQKITDEEAYETEITKYKEARVLFIDDMLKGRITESDVNIMFDIVNHRYLNFLPMIVTTEKAVDELLAFDEAIGSRILEMCKGNVVYFERGKGLNYRLR